MKRKPKNKQVKKQKQVIPANPKERIALIKAVAKTFADLLKQGLTEKQWRDMQHDNARETSPGVCHSHDHCDANMVMDAAMRKHGINPLPKLEDGMAGDVVALWNDTWDFAKAVYLGGGK